MVSAPAKQKKATSSFTHKSIPSAESGGFTIVEVMIALAVSTIIFTAGVAALSSRRSSTEFSQGIYDAQSQIQQYIDQVSSRVLPGYQNYTCALNSSNRPVLTPVASPGTETTGNDCIYLGQAIGIVHGGSSIFSYPVYGSRLAHDGGPDDGQPITSILEANPEPAMDSSGNLLMVNKYSLYGGLTEAWSRISNDTDFIELNLMTFYSDPQNSNTSGNDIVAAAHYFYPGLNSDDDATSSALKACIENTGSEAGSCNYDVQVPIGYYTKDYSSLSGSWDVCITNGTSSGLIIFAASATGITSNVQIKQSTNCS